VPGVESNCPVCRFTFTEKTFHWLWSNSNGGEEELCGENVVNDYNIMETEGNVLYLQVVLLFAQRKPFIFVHVTHSQFYGAIFYEVLF
jgi:hypothetical protein